MGNQPSQRGAALVDAGNDAFRREQFDKAIELHLKALRFLGPDSIEQAECLDHLGKEYWRVGNIADALKYSKLALAIKEKKIPDTSSLAKTLSNIGCIFHERGEYEKAFYLLEGALTIRQKIDPKSLEVSITCTNLGLVLMQLGRVHEAVKLHHEARKIKEVIAPGSVTLARTYINLANICSAVQEHTKAVSFLLKAKTIAKSLDPIPESLLATIDMNFGNIMYSAGATKKAICYYQKAVEREAKVAPESLVLAEMCTELAKAYEELGLRAEARAEKFRALSIRSQKAPFEQPEAKSL